MRTGENRRPDYLRRAVLPVMSALLAACNASPDTELARGFLSHLLTPTSEKSLHVSSYDRSGGNLDRLEVLAGDSAVILDQPGPGVIRRIWITVASRDPHYLRRIALKMYWDDETTPSVQAPLGDFFGNGFDRRHYAALPMGVSSGGFYCYLPMPFQRHARIVIENGTGRTIDAFYYNIDLAQVDEAPARLATFHAWWHRDPRTTDPAPHLVLSARGSGHFVGMSLNAESHNGRLWFLEGDEILSIDGEFRGQGTGTEDYFNGGWYFDQGAFAAPFHGVVIKDDESARVAAYRWHLLDPVSFSDSIRIDLEHGHANQEVADYATMAYWYQLEPHVPLPALPSPDDRRVLSAKIPPGAVPADSLAVAVGAGGIRVMLPVPRPDLYEVVIYPLGGPGLGAARFGVAERRPRTVQLEHPEANTVLPPVTLDTVAASDAITLTASSLGTASAARLRPAALHVVPVRRWAREWHVVGPFPNPQQPGTEISPAIDSVYGPELDPDLAAEYAGALEGRIVRWQLAEAGDDGRLRLNSIFATNDWVAAYAQTFLYSPDSREATLLLGADDAHVLWVNGERLSERQGRHISVPDELEIPVRLRAGWNRVLLKVADLDGGWAVMVRASDQSGLMRWAARP